MTDPDAVVPRPQAAVEARDLGWAFLLGQLVTAVPADSWAAAADIAARAAAAAGPDAEGHLRAEITGDRCQLRLRSWEASRLTRRDLDLAAAINGAVGGAASAGSVGGRAVQLWEIAIDALDIPAVRPFWRAVLGYTDSPGQGAPDDDVIDPVGFGPSVWFQQMDEPRPQRNRIHFDLTLPEDEAETRMAAALAAGGQLVSDEYAKSFWILADAEGNEICLCTWQDRD